MTFRQLYSYWVYFGDFTVVFKIIDNYFHRFTLVIAVTMAMQD